MVLNFLLTVNGEKMESCNYTPIQYKKVDHFKEWLNKLDNGIIDEIPHSYGVLPFVFTHRENQTDSFYVEGANDIINANEHINIAMTEIMLMDSRAINSSHYFLLI